MDENENNSTLDDTRKQPGSQNKKSAGEKLSNAKDNVKKAKDVVKKAKSLGKLGTVGIVIAVIILILFITIGTYEFIMTLPGLSSEKITKTAKNFWKWLSNDDRIEVDEKEMKELAEYIENMGFDIVGYGFAQSGRVDADGNINENDYKNITNVRYSNIYAYILANERTYTLQGTSNGAVNDKLFEYITFGVERWTIEQLSKVFRGGRKNVDQAHY